MSAGAELAAAVAIGSMPANVVELAGKRPAAMTYAQWCDAVGRWEQKVLRPALEAMSAAERAQWERPVCGKGEKDPAFKRAPDLRRPSSARGMVRGKPRAHARDGRLRFAPADTADGLAMAATMAELGAAPSVVDPAPRTFSALHAVERDGMRDGHPRHYPAEHVTYALRALKPADGFVPSSSTAPACSPRKRAAVAVVDLTAPAKVPTADERYAELTAGLLALCELVESAGEAAELVAAAERIDAALAARKGKR